MNTSLKKREKLQDEYLKKVETDLIMKTIKELTGYVNESLDVGALKSAKNEVMEKLEVLKAHRLSLETAPTTNYGLLAPLATPKC